MCETKVRRTAPDLEGRPGGLAQVDHTLAGEQLEQFAPGLVTPLHQLGEVFSFLLATVGLLLGHLDQLSRRQKQDT